MLRSISFSDMRERKTAVFEFDTRSFLDQLDPVQIKTIYAETDVVTLKQELKRSQELENYRTCRAIQEWLVTLQ
jgi:hypothetical protein